MQIVKTTFKARHITDKFIRTLQKITYLKSAMCVAIISPKSADRYLALNARDGTENTSPSNFHILMTKYMTSQSHDQGSRW